MKNIILGCALGHVLIFIISSVVVMSTLTGCSTRFERMMEDAQQREMGGYVDRVYDLPFAAGYSTLCTQGAHGSFSHSSDSTEYDLDLDTPNNSQDLVYASISGIAHVHTESATRGFGYHINIDLGDGTYIVIAHLADVYIRDGEEVAAGQILGLEGCTGACTGDHVHIGLHKGDAAEPAEFGGSRMVSFIADIATTGEKSAVATTEEFVCGTSDGYVYSSILPVTTWHPNGSLIKTPWSEKVYLIQDGQKHWIQDQDVFWSLGYSFQDVALVSEAEMDCYDSGLTISQNSSVRSVTDPDGQVWLAVGNAGDSDSYRILVQKDYMEPVLASWGLSYTVSSMPAGGVEAEEVLSQYPEQSGYANFRDGSLVREESESTVYVIADSVAMPIKDYQVFLRLGFGTRDIIWVDDGALEAVQGAIGSCESGFWCVDADVIESCQASEPLEFGDVGGGSDEDGVDPSSMLEGEIDDGEFGLVFVPPSSYGAEQAVLSGQAYNQSGEQIFSSEDLAVNYRDGLIVWQTDRFDPNTEFDFSVAYSDGMTTRYSCEWRSDQAKLNGTLYGLYGDNQVEFEVASHNRDDEYCLIRPRRPMGEIKPSGESGDTGDDGSSDTGKDDSADTGPGSEPHKIRVCYFPPEPMYDGELYLDGNWFSYWSSSPADTAAEGDTKLCKSVKAESGEQIKLNAWWQTEKAGDVDWAAYNNWCESIDFQGKVKVDGTKVSVTTAPWSESAWESTPCDIGGDAFFNVP